MSKIPILFLHNRSYDTAERIFSDQEAWSAYEVHLVTSAKYADPRLQDLCQVTVTNISDLHELEVFCGRLIEENAIRYVSTVTEYFVLLAARLRDTYGLPGMTFATAQRFRDKVLMKILLAAEGVCTPAFAVVHTQDEVLAFHERHGRCVLKPIQGVGAKGLTVIGSARELPDVTECSQEMEVEAFIDAPMAHCDAITVAGDVQFFSAGQYLQPPGAYRQALFNSSVQIEDAALLQRLRGVQEHINRVLGLEDGVTHLEVFLTPELVFCEIAARPGGGGISETVEFKYGVNLLRAQVYLDCGRREALVSERSARAQAAGHLGILGPQNEGIVQILAEGRHRGQVLEVQGVTPSQAASPQHCTDYSALCLVQGESHQALRSDLQELQARIAATWEA